MKSIVLVGVASIVLSACGGGGGSSTPTPSPAPAPAPAPAVGTSSYVNYKQIGLVPQPLPSGDNTMRAYANFSGTGRTDMFRAVITYDPSKPQSAATPSRFEFWNKQADGTFVKNTTLLASSDGCLHPRKALVADFNGDGRPDVFVACHGYDAAPYPGERSKVVLSQPDGTYKISDAASDVGFWHGASAADLNGDGKIDVVQVSDGVDKAVTMINDGTGKFSRETTIRTPKALRNMGGYFSIELVDVNEDGKLDLVVGGHEFENAPTWIFLNPGNNDFSAVSPTVVPAVPNEGVVLDFTLTGTGPTRTLWVVRTSGGDGTFYQSRTVQKVSYPSMTSTVVLQQRPATWIPWLVPATVNGIPVVVSDNAADGISLPQ